VTAVAVVGDTRVAKLGAAELGTVAHRGSCYAGTGTNVTDFARRCDWHVVRWWANDGEVSRRDRKTGHNIRSVTLRTVGCGARCVGVDI
jgi:hypothetical protein